MKTIYAPLTKRGNIVVEPLQFNESELDAQAFLSLMAVGSSDGAPLYIQILLVSRASNLLCRSAHPPIIVDPA